MNALRDLAIVAGVAILLGASACSREAVREEQPKRELRAAVDPDLVTLPSEALSTSHVTTAPAELRRPVDAITVAGTIQPDQQRMQQVTALISGRVDQVYASIGSQVLRGAALAVISSPEIADMKGKLVAAEGHERVAKAAAARTRRLVEIGAAAGKDAQVTGAELEAAQAEAAHLRDALRAFGASSAGGSGIASVTLRAPITGIVTERFVNPGAGMQAGQPLFTIADLRSVWIIARVSEAQMAFVSIGAKAEVRAAVLRDAPISGVVDYIDPTLHPETHTASVRIRVNNPRESLRVGMYAGVRIETSQTSAAPSVPWIPSSAVDHIGERTVVFVAEAGKAGTFRARDVHVGDGVGESIPVLSGLQPGERVVVTGTFAVKSQLLKKQFGENE